MSVSCLQEQREEAVRRAIESERHLLESQKQAAELARAEAEQKQEAARLARERGEVEWISGVVYWTRLQ